MNMMATTTTTTNAREVLRKEEDNNASSNAGSIHLLDLPTELLTHVFAFMDIPMLGRMAQVSSQGPIWQLSTANEPIWSKLVKRRFHIATSTKRSKAFGGKDWKDAYRTLHMCHRMPKCRWTNRKAIFAKQASGSSTSSCLSMWVTLNHTDNCRTRTLRLTRSNTNDNATTPSQHQRRYVEFWVCFQNVKTGGPTVQLDLKKAQLQFLSGLGGTYTEVCLNREEFTRCGTIRSWIMPRVLHKHSNAAAAAPTTTTTTTTTRPTRANILQSYGGINDDDKHGIISLKPLEFCIASIPFSCGQDDIYETDVLARTVSLHVPFTTTTTSIKNHHAAAAVAGGSVSDTAAAGGGEENDRKMTLLERKMWSNCVPPTMLMDNKDDVVDSQQQQQQQQPYCSEEEEATAWFVPESDVWDHYCELPGGCLTLSDRERRLHV